MFYFEAEQCSPFALAYQSRILQLLHHPKLFSIYFKNHKPSSKSNKMSELTSLTGIRPTFDQLEKAYHMLHDATPLLFKGNPDFPLKNKVHDFIRAAGIFLLRDDVRSANPENRYIPTAEQWSWIKVVVDIVERVLEHPEQAKDAIAFLPSIKPPPDMKVSENPAPLPPAHPEDIEETSSQGDLPSRQNLRKAYKKLARVTKMLSQNRFAYSPQPERFLEDTVSAAKTFLSRDDIRITSEYVISKAQWQWINEIINVIDWILAHPNCSKEQFANAIAWLPDAEAPPDLYPDCDFLADEVSGLPSMTQVLNAWIVLVTAPASLATNPNLSLQQKMNLGKIAERALSFLERDDEGWQGSVPAIPRSVMLWEWVEKVFTTLEGLRENEGEVLEALIQLVEM